MGSRVVLAERIVDLTPVNGLAYNIGGAYVATATTGSGSGTFTDLLGVQYDSRGNSPDYIEEGYNTSGAFFYDEQGGTHTSGKWLSEMELTAAINRWWYSFALDAHEKQNGRDDWLSVDRIEIYLMYDPNHAHPVDNKGRPAYSGAIETLAAEPASVLVWSLDGVEDTTILLDATANPGSGNSEMSLMVPSTLFAAALGVLGDPAPEDVAIYFYTQMGAYGVDPETGRDYGASSTAEQWATYYFDDGSALVPEPGTYGVLVGGGLLGMVGVRLLGRAAGRRTGAASATGRRCG
ncbi:MAG: hypothetical protein H7A45_13220 [Verrucomicrobiales bacterium]|nr:hypothetical protein [Verrucomicrobiales bacterium]